MATVGFLFGMMGMSLGALTYLKLGQLEKRLKAMGILDKDFPSE